MFLQLLETSESQNQPTITTKPKAFRQHNQPNKSTHSPTGKKKKRTSSLYTKPTIQKHIQHVKQIKVAEVNTTAPYPQIKKQTPTLTLPKSRRTKYNKKENRTKSQQTQGSN